MPRPAYQTPFPALSRSARCSGRAGVLAGNGKTGFAFGLMDWKPLKTFFPLFRAGTYFVPKTLM